AVANCTPQTEVVSSGVGGEPPNAQSELPSLSADGRFVVFDSLASNLVAGDTDGAFDVFVHDRVTGVTDRVSISTAGTEGQGGSQRGAISGDGRYVVFSSGASYLVPGRVIGGSEIFEHDRLTGATQALIQSGYVPTISRDGRVLAWYGNGATLRAP